MKKKWIWIAIVVVLIAIIAIPIIINESYKTGQVYVTVWNGSDMLSYYGSVLGAVGTIVLGLVAYWQNINLHKSQKRLENKKLTIETFALFDFSNFNITFYNSKNTDEKKEMKCFESGFNGNVGFWTYKSMENMDELRIKCNIKNIGLYPAVNLYVGDKSGAKIEDANVMSSASEDEANDKKYIINGDIGTLILIVDINELNENKHLDYYLIFTNPFGYKYSQKITVLSRYADHGLIEINAQGTLNNIEIMDE